MLPKSWQSSAAAFVEEFSLVEADFQQYYHLDLLEVCPYADGRRSGFSRYARLFENLPVESRIFRKLVPVASWTWRDETLSQILQELNILTTLTYNMNKRKTAKPAKTMKKFEPEYVSEMRKQLDKDRKKQQAEEQDDLKDLWQHLNPNAQYQD
nr:MAG TPA: protein of unknown function (DUF5361) [Caudoviricetes sp.]